MRIGVDFNKVILAPNLSLEAEILYCSFPDVKTRPQKCTWKEFQRQDIPRDRFEELRDMIYLPAYRYRLSPVKGAFDTLRRFVESGHDVLVVTSRVGRSCELSKEWFHEMSGLAIIPFIGVGTDENGVKKSKGDVLRKYDIHVYIDNSDKKRRQILRERAQFKKLPKLLHFRLFGREEEWSPPYTVPAFSWLDIRQRTDAIVTM